jgi:rod shape-determining protein MreD
MRSDFRIALLVILAAFALAIMPLPDWAVKLRPDWVTLAMIYWAMALPSRIGVMTAWFAGLMLDVAHGAILGQHAVGLVLVVYVVLLQHQRMRVASLLQQALVVLVLLLLKQLLVLWVDGIVGRSPDSWLYFVPSLIGALLWPWVFIVLRDLRRKFDYRGM